MQAFGFLVLCLYGKLWFHQNRINRVIVYVRNYLSFYFWNVLVRVEFYPLTTVHHSFCGFLPFIVTITQFQHYFPLPTNKICHNIFGEARVVHTTMTAEFSGWNVSVENYWNLQPFFYYWCPKNVVYRYAGIRLKEYFTKKAAFLAMEVPRWYSRLSSRKARTDFIIPIHVICDMSILSS